MVNGKVDAPLLADAAEAEKQRRNRTRRAAASYICVLNLGILFTILGKRGIN